MDRSRLAQLEPFQTLIETAGPALTLPEPFARLLPRLVLPPAPGARPGVVVNFVVRKKDVLGTCAYSDFKYDRR